MKTIETKLYCFNELSESAKKRVIDCERNRIANEQDNFTLEECVDSLKAVADALGVRLTDWQIGPYSRTNYCQTNCEDSGNKATARFVRMLVDAGYPRKKTFREMLARGTGSFQGFCKFTGVCFDEDVCEAILEALLDGETVSKAFDRAADRIQKICEDDLEYRQTDESILEYLDQKAEIYDEDGNEF